MTDIVQWNPDDFAGVGLEDVDESDFTTPRLNINHDKGVFVNSQTEEEWQELYVVVLGRIRQRIMWRQKYEDDKNIKPQCRSNDNKLGFPNFDQTSDRRDLFPWDQSNFNSAPLEVNPEYNEYTLPCDDCAFKEWGENGDKPLCNAQWAIPLYYVVEGGAYLPAVFTVRSTGLVAFKSYFSAFAMKRESPMLVHTHMSLREAKQGRNTYFIPQFKRNAATDGSYWQSWADSYKGMRNFITRPPIRVNEDNGDDVGEMSDNTNTDPWADGSTQAEDFAPPADDFAPPPVPAPAPASAPTPQKATAPAPATPVKSAPTAPSTPVKASAPRATPPSPPATKPAAPGPVAPRPAPPSPTRAPVPPPIANEPAFDESNVIEGNFIGGEASGDLPF
jgi:hypothetical protein